jgi:hypothetical protein
MQGRCHRPFLEGCSSRIAESGRELPWSLSCPWLVGWVGCNLGMLLEAECQLEISTDTW